MDIISVKALGDWELEVLGCPYYGPDGGKDADGEYFSPDTKFHEDKYSLPPVVYYHGFTPEGRPAGEPQYIGKAIGRETRQDGVWYRVVLDKVYVDEWGTDPQKPLALLTPDELKKAYVRVDGRNVPVSAVPMTDRRQIVKALQATGQAATEQAIVEMYLAGQKKGPAK
jgi:hypothetical protein